MENQADIIVAGFFRTGNTFIETCINAMYKDNKCISVHDHSVKYLSKQIEQGKYIVSPVRKPLDSISSFYEFKKFLNKKDEKEKISMDIKFYTRYMNFLYDNFDIFTKNVEYTSNSIYKKFQIQKTNDIDLDLINQYMEKNKSMFFNKRDVFLPSDEIKKDILNTEEIKYAMDIYNKLKNKMEESYNG